MLTVINMLISSQAKLFTNTVLSYYHVQLYTTAIFKGCLSVSGVVDVFASTLAKYGIKETRLPFQMGIEDHVWTQQWLRDFFAVVNRMSRDAEVVLTKQGCAQFILWQKPPVSSLVCFSGLRILATFSD